MPRLARTTSMIKPRTLGAMVLLLLGLGSQRLHAAPLCPKLDQAALRQMAQERGPLHLIFFASWCGECAKHLKAEHSGQTILIATFDEEAAAERAIRKLGIKTPCYFDDGLSEAFGIKSVPHTLEFKAP